MDGGQHRTEEIIHSVVEIFEARFEYELIKVSQTTV